MVNYTTFDSVNMSSGLHNAFTYASDTVPIFIPMMLFSFWLIILLSSYFMQKNYNRENLAGSFTVASFVTTIVAQVLMLIPDLVTLPTLITFYGLTILGVFWVFIRNQN